MISFPGCKVNIGLNIVGKRTDGFHELESVFYPIPWTDVLEITTSDETETRLITLNSSEVIPTQQNIVWKAYKLLQVDYNLPPVRMNLLKNVPTGAGLGGGSADGSHTLRVLNSIFDLRISEKKLFHYSEKLGSDCPFFIQDSPCYITGRGENLKPIDLDLSTYYGVVVNPGVHISTKQAFSTITPGYPEHRLSDVIQLPIDSWKDLIKNDFEQGIFKLYPEISYLKNSLYQMGAVFAIMTGTGSSVFALFESKPDLSKINSEYSRWSGKLTT